MLDHRQGPKTCKCRKTIQIKNGEKVSPTFSAQEYANRQAKLRAYMAQNNIDAAVFTSYHNLNYYSDFLYCYRLV